MFAKFCVLCALVLPAMALYFIDTQSQNSIYSITHSSSDVTFSKSYDPDAYDLYPLNNVAVQRKIEQYHNEFRTQVQPNASNMLYMSWHPGAAGQAQMYAEKCIFLVHNPGQERTVPLLGQCGQNLFASEQKTPWFSVINTWFLENRKFTLGSPEYNVSAVGHYTQMVWATSHKVGCGLAHCPGGPWGQFYNYVCHYCPGGNIQPGLEYPYKPGKPCADCPDHCISDSLCTNSCNEQDFFVNCNELVGYPGTCDGGDCNATCQCGSKLHKNYPWE